MNRKKSVFTVFINLILLIGLLYGAIRIPKVMADFQDTKLLEKVSEKEFNFSTYELTYESVSDKLYSIAYVISQGLEIDYLWLNEGNSKEIISNAELTEHVSEELEKFVSEEFGVDISVSENQLKIRELCSLYAGLEEYGDNLLSGIKIYRLVYICDGYEIELYIDSEFYTIYNLMINVYGDKDLIDRVYDTNINKNILIVDRKLEKESVYISLDTILNYWDIQENGVAYPDDNIMNVSDSSEKLYTDSMGRAIIRFEDGVELPIEIVYSYARDYYFWISMHVI